MTKDEAFKCACGANLYVDEDGYPRSRAQPEQEPVAKVCHDLDGHIGWNPKLTQLPDEGTLLYTKPPQRKPLTEEQLEMIWRDGPYDHGTLYDFKLAARATEAAHGIKEKA